MSTKEIDDLCDRLGVPPRVLAGGGACQNGIAHALEHALNKRERALRRQIERKVIRPMIDRLIDWSGLAVLEPIYLCSPRGTLCRVVRPTYYIAPPEPPFAYKELS